MLELVSIIVPVYNVAKYLPRCIDSILRQTFKNLQVILVNDGSIDESTAICEEYALRDSRIEVINKKNGGLSDARNVGISRAKGVYIALIDSDDYVHERYIESMYNCIKRDNSDMCFCGFHYVNEGDEDWYAITRSPVCYDIHPSIHLAGCHPAGEIMKVIDTIELLYFVAAWNKLYRRELFDKIKYPIGRLHEDVFVLHRLLAACNSVSMISDCLYYYLQRPTSIMGKAYSARRLDVLDAYDDRIHFYIENKTCSLLRNTCLSYIRRYTKARWLLPMDAPENIRRWKECAAKFRAHAKTMFVHGGFIMGLRFLLAVISPRAYHVLSRLKRRSMKGM